LISIGGVVFFLKVSYLAACKSKSKRKRKSKSKSIGRTLRTFGTHLVACKTFGTPIAAKEFFMMMKAD
jgi:hypothetical protein